VNEVDVIRDVLDLIALEMADEMPSNSAVVEPVALLHKFLRVVLAKIKDPRRNRLPDYLYSKGLGNTQ
jgi:hypothetical protein